MRKDLVLGLLGGILSLSVALAQTTTTPITTTPATEPAPTVAPATEAAIAQPTLATTVPVTAIELGVAEQPGFFTLLGLRLQRVFAFSAIKRARVTDELARTLLQQARIALAAGDEAKADLLITRYNQETARAALALNQALSQIDLTANPSAQTLVNQLQEAKILEAAVVDEMSLKATGEFNKRLIKERAEIAKKLVKLLAKEDLTPAELERKIAKLTAKLAEKEAKAEDKLAKRLAALNLLDEAADEREDEGELDELDDGEEFDLDEAIGNVEEDEIAALASQPVANLGVLISKIPGSTTKHLVILQALLNRVPEGARGTIEAVLAKELDKAKTKLERKQAQVDELVDDNSPKFKEAKEKLLVRLQDKADERIGKAIEKSTKKLQKAEERRLKSVEKQAKQATEQREDDDDDEDDDVDEPAKAATSSPSPTSSPAATETPKSGEPKTYKIELEDDGFKTTSLTIAVGDSVTFEVKDEGSYQVRSGPHPVHSDLPELDSGAVGKGAKYSFTFKKSGTFRFHDHLHTSFTGTITVK